ncbi:CaiB/BaiF CoA-transferase family protein [Rhizobacter sp. SG703]|uniref:CaiB/BaiF CoA transferase family protein n=1 Tax=Rhizobacter sp. SG703 TaxID=2587140 RepID=UPI0014463B83|nr:CaiB/BaiF CoA-transferase family protein [Rhizobacter sp. SG703]
MRPPLLGVQVVDMSRLLPGPLAALELQRLGASVLKIEGPPGQQDGARELWRTDAERAAGEPALMFRRLNEGKALRTLDLRDDADRAALLDEVTGADVLIEGFRPGAMDRLGLGWPVLSARNPRLVMCSISGYGQTGPWAERAGHDINYIAMAGVLDQLATPDGELVAPNFQIGDLMGGTQAAVAGILAALLAVQRGGSGRHVDISMTHEVRRHHVLADLVVAQTGRAPQPGSDLLSGGAPCYGVYRTADGRHLAVGALELPFWQRLCVAIERPDWSDRHWSLGLQIGSPESLALRDALADLVFTRTLSAWWALLAPVDCCVTPVLRLDESHAHELFVNKR